MTSAYCQAAAGQPIAELVRRFPSVSVFDIDELLTQVRSMIDKAVLAVQSVFIFTLCAGLVVMLAAVQATRDERRYESAMLRTLGASRSRRGAGRARGVRRCSACCPACSRRPVRQWPDTCWRVSSWRSTAASIRWSG